MVSVLQKRLSRLFETYKASLSKFSLMQNKTLFLVSPQEFKAFVLYLAFFVVTASGATLCKCGEEEKKVKRVSICSLLMHQIHALFFARFWPLTKEMKQKG